MSITQSRTGCLKVVVAVALSLFLTTASLAQQAHPDTSTTTNPDTSTAATKRGAVSVPDTNAARATATRSARSGVNNTSSQLVVGVSDTPPFAIKGDRGNWQGIAIHLWRAVADSLNLSYQLREVSASQQVVLVEDGSLDLALTPAATAEAEQRVDFAPVYYAATIGVAGSRRRSFMSMVSAFFSARFFWIVAGLAVLLLFMGTLMWLVERKSNEDHFGGERGPVNGVGSGFWWAAVTMTTIGYGDKTPTSFWGRALALLWMLIAMVITAMLTASLVSIVTSEGSGSSLTAPGKLRSTKVGTEAGSPGEAFLKENDVSYRTLASPTAGLRALKKDSISAFVYSTPVLKYLTSKKRDLATTVESTGWLSQRYAFAHSEGDPRAETLRRIVRAHIDSGSWHELLKRYLPRNRR